MSEQSKGTGWYLYGLIDTYPPTPTFSGSADVRCIRFRDMAALVSEVSLDEFDESRLPERLNDPKWLEGRLRHHEYVLEAFMRCGTVIPMRFATIFKTEERLSEHLLALYDTLRELLQKLREKEEWGVKAFCDLRSIKASVEVEHERARQLKAQLAGQPPGTAYLMRKQLEDLLAQETDHRLACHLESIYQRLSSLAHEAKLNLLTPHQLTNRKQEMVLNAVFLIEKTSVGNLAEAVRALRGEYCGYGFEFELVGPFPPYNFSRLPEEATHERRPA